MCQDPREVTSWFTRNTNPFLVSTQTTRVPPHTNTNTPYLKLWRDLLQTFHSRPVEAAGEVNDTRGRPNPLPRSDNHTSNHSDTLFRLEGLKVKDVWDESVATCFCVCC